MSDLFHMLQNVIKGEIYHDPIHCSIYSVDASIYEVTPLGVVIPMDRQDLINALKIAGDYKIPVTVRGAATGITGSCLGRGLIIDISKHLNRILEINFEQEYAICEPGVVQDRLNEALAPHGYRLGPDTSTGNRATLGGMLGNNAAGARSLIYGCMADHVLEMELALAGGETMVVGEFDEVTLTKKQAQKNREGQIYRELFHILQSYQEAIRLHLPHIPRRVSGYSLDRLLKAPPLNICSLITGSEGTLGIATRIKVKIVKKPAHTGVCVIHVPNMVAGLHHLSAMLAHIPIALEMIDHQILTAARGAPSVKHQLKWLSGNPEAVFVAEFEAESVPALHAKLETFTQSMKALHVGESYALLTNPHEISAVWEVRKAGLGLLLSKRSYSRAIAFIEDISIAPEKLPYFLEAFIAYLKKIGKEAGIYGHIGSGCMHIRPYIDLRKKEEMAHMQAIMLEVSDMVLAYGGAMSGEHGDGLIRSWLNEKMFGADLYQAFQKVKAAFDPDNLMNPSKIVNGPPLEENLRQSPDTRQISIPTFLDFSQEGGFELAVDLCNGNGQCRKKEGVMCPSFQASDDEYHTTRARAQSLQNIIHGKLPKEELINKGLYDVLDLCIECKGCKRECPSQVDMAKMKSEVLYQYQERHGYSIRNRLFAFLPSINRLTSPFASVANRILPSRFGKMILGWLGITQKRDLPAYALERFSTWFHYQAQQEKKQKVILFCDTYTEFHEPEIGKAAFQILQDLGFEIVLAEDACCGRPFISKGFLKQAKDNALQNVKRLTALMKDGMSMVVLEPSCVSAFRDDYQGLLGKHSDLETLKERTVSFDEFLFRQMQEGNFPFPFSDKKQTVWVHGHCHQKALEGMASTLEVLKALGITVKEIESGCCGMAGAFGYEKEHYDFSMKIGGLKLFPQLVSIKKEDCIIVNGFSCRHQMKDGAHRSAVHLSLFLATLSKSYGKEPSF